MKIARLDLLAFGPFTRCSLQLDEGQCGLHLVYGPNEAGKSTALRALRHGLFGIPHNSDDNFLHPHTQLRVGGCLEAAQGERFEFIRRKGRSKTLRGPDDEALADEARLAALLGDMDEMAFRQRYGMDYEQLRRGGQAIVTGAGELGEILFAAGTGIADVRQLQATLDAELQALFKPAGTQPRINDLVKRLTEAKRAMKQAQLSTSEWSRLDKALQAAEGRQAEVEDALRDRRAAKNRLERLTQALPCILRRRLARERLAELTGAPLLPADFAEQRGVATSELSSARRAVGDAEREIEQLRQAIAGQPLASGLLQHRERIVRLHSDLGGYQKATQDRPGLAARWEQAEQQTRQLLGELSDILGSSQVAPQQLTRVQRDRIQTLASDCKTFLDRQEAAERDLDQLRLQLQLVEQQQRELPELQDPTELRQAVRRARKLGDLDAHLSAAESKLQEVERQAAMARQQLRLYHGSLEQLEALPIPTPETLERFEVEFSAAERAVQQAQIERQRLADEQAELQEKAERLRLEYDVPTEADLAHSRDRREAAWQRLLQWWRGPSGDDAGASAATPHPHRPGESSADAGAAATTAPAWQDLATAFRGCLDEADQIADRLRREADRVAEKSMLESGLQQLARQLQRLRDTLAAAQEKQAQLQAEWRQLWSEMRIEPLTPREMRAWRHQQQALAQTACDIRRQRREVDLLTDQRAEACRDLERCWQLLGQQRTGATSGLAVALEWSESLVEAMDQANARRDRLVEQTRALQAELAEAELTVTQVTAQRVAWQTEWAAAVTAAGLPEAATPSEAHAVLGLLDALQSSLKEAEGLRHRIDGIDADAQRFRTAVHDLVSRAANDLLSQPVELAVPGLVERLAAASEAQAQVGVWKSQLQAELGKRDQALARAAQSEESLQALCRLAGCAGVEALAEAEQRSAERREAERDFREMDMRLSELAAGADLECFIAEAEALDADQLRAELQQRIEQIEQLEREKSEVAEQVGSARHALQQMDGSDRAAQALEQSEQLLAELRTESEQFVRLKLASLVLRRAMDRFRESQQGPVLAAASDLFARLTLNSFRGIRAEFDDKGQAMLVGVRAATGQLVGVNGMSAGTCDQLYLALRLAILEAELPSREPLPFIVDDILIMYDDERASAALHVLARLSRKTQVIFFTHHEHLVSLARKNVAEGMLFVHTLPEVQAASREPADVAG